MAQIQFSLIKKNKERLYVQNTRYPHPLLFYAGAVVVTNRLGAKIDKVAWRKEPMWKRRLQNKIKELRKDLSQLEVLIKISVILDIGKDYKEKTALE